MNSSPISLISCNQSIFESILKSDNHLAELLQINVPEQWSEFGRQAFEYGLSKIIESPDSVAWWTYFPILKESNTLIGSCGFKGLPNEQGEVEIGYEVAKVYRNKGFATEIARQLIDKAFLDKNVKSIIAHTLAMENPSVSVLRKCQFKLIEEIIDPEDGLIWRWILKK